MTSPIKFELIDIDDYHAAMRKPEVSLADAELRAMSVAKGPFGGPSVHSGGFAAVFRLFDTLNKGHAVRCFIRLAPDLADRYAAISRHLSNELHRQDRREPFLVTTKYFERGVKTIGGWKPITTMPWVEGETLDAYVDRCWREPHRFGRLLAQIQKLDTTLRSLRVGHGDLQHRNILVDANGTMHLIDYDGMWVPALEGKKSNEVGVADYQHPGRTWEHFGEKMDRFSLLVLHLNLHAISRHPEIWDPKTRGEGLLLRAADFKQHDRSDRLAALAQYDDLAPHVTKFRRVCEGPVNEVPSLAEFLADLRPIASVIDVDVAPASPSVDGGETTPASSDSQPQGQVPIGDPTVIRLPASDAPRIAARQDILERYLGQLVTVRGTYEGFSKADTSSGRYRILHLRGEDSTLVSISADPIVVSQVRETGRSWTVKKGQELTASGLLVGEDGRYVLQLDQAASLVRGPIGAVRRAVGGSSSPHQARPQKKQAPPDNHDTFFDGLFDGGSDRQR